MAFMKHLWVVILPVLLAVALPFTAVIMFPYHSCDIEIFSTWADCIWRGRAVNGVCEQFHINYPSIGISASAGVMQLLSWFGFEGHFRMRAQPFRMVAAVVDSVNIFLFLALLRVIGVRFAEWWTLLFAVLPSSRVGGAMFGQIDGVSQLFLSLGFLCAHQGWRVLDTKGEFVRAQLWLFGVGASLICAVFTKQLVVFTAPVLGFLFLFLCYKSFKAGARLWSLVLGVSLLLVALFVSDRLFPVPDGFSGSILLYSLLAGSGHGGEISNNGFNVFTLLSAPPLAKSNQWHHFFDLFGARVMGIPMYIGLVLFSVTNIIALISLRSLLRSSAPVDATTGTVAALAMAAFLNLSMNVFLTGTHERYLYHYGFFIVPGLLWLRSRREVSGVVLALVFAHLIIYGLFVFSVIGPLPPILRSISSQRGLTLVTLLVCLAALAGVVRAATDCRARGSYKSGS